jgi:aspartokinase
MVTAAHVVKKIIMDKPFIEEAILLNIINYGGLADLLLPDIEKELRTKVSHASVMMAIRRYAEQITKKELSSDILEYIKDINVRSNLFEITIYKSNESKNILQKVQNLPDARKGDFLSIITGLHEISIISNERLEQEILKIIPKKEIKHKMKNISGITINLSEEATEAAGIFYILTKSLALENISIIEIISTWTETSFIVKTKDAGRTFTVIKDILEKKSRNK